MESNTYPSVDNEASSNHERMETTNFQGGASIVYVHTFCAELLGESSLELCRSELKLKCDLDVLSWFKLGPDESKQMIGRL